MALFLPTGDLIERIIPINSLKEFHILARLMEEDWQTLRLCLSEGIPDELPTHPGIDNTVDHAPSRRQVLDDNEKVLAIRNALRYFDSKHHGKLAVEFLG